MTFHHVGIPTTNYLPEDSHNADLKMHATGYFLKRLMPWSGQTSMKTVHCQKSLKRNHISGYVVENLEDAISGETSF